MNHTRGMHMNKIMTKLSARKLTLPLRSSDSDNTLGTAGRVLDAKIVQIGNEYIDIIIVCAREEAIETKPPKGFTCDLDEGGPCNVGVCHPECKFRRKETA